MSFGEKSLLVFTVVVLLAVAGMVYLFILEPEGRAPLDTGPGGTERAVPSAAPTTTGQERSFEQGKPRSMTPGGETGALQGEKEETKESLAPRAVDARNAGQVIGRVVDTKKTPVAGAEVILFQEIRRHPRVDLPLLKETRELRAVTDEAGRYFFQGVPAPGLYELTASAPNLAPLARPKAEVKPGALSKAPDLILGRGWTVKGKVQNTAGALLEGAKLLLERSEAMGNPLEWETDPTEEAKRPREKGSKNTEETPSPRRARAETDENGRFTFLAVGAGFYQVSAWAPGYCLLVKETDTRKAPEGGEITVDFILEHAQEIHGRVEDREHTPLGGVEVRAALDKRRKGFSRARTRTERKEGRFVLRNLSSGRYILSARKEGYLPAFATNIQSGSRNVRMGMKKAASASGRVLASDTGKPVRDFAVAVYADRNFRPGMPRPMVRSWKGVHDEEGRFIVEGLQQGRYVVAARAEGYADGYAPALSLKISKSPTG